MRMTSIAIARLLAGAGSTALFGSGGDARQLSRTIEAEGATSAGVRISMATGDLTIGGGAAALLDADFTYDPDLEPQFSYSVGTGVGELRIEQPRNADRRSGQRNLPNIWDLRFTHAIPLDLRVTLASADSKLRLGSLALRMLDLDISSGNCGADLSGDQPHLYQVGARMASGDLELALTGRYRQPVSIAVNTASGDLDLDLRGGWAAGATVRVRVASGAVELKTPNDVAVVVRTKTLSGDVRAGGLQRSGAGFTNNLAGVAAVGLDIEVETLSGDIRIDGRGPA